MEINSSGEETVIKVSCSWTYQLICGERINIFFMLFVGAKAVHNNKTAGAVDRGRAQTVP